MKRLLTLALLVGMTGAVKAQFRHEPRSARSVSGQFVAYASKPAYTSRFHLGNADSISLEPAVLAIAAERIKEALYRKLDDKSNSKGKIFLHLRPARHASEQATIVIEPGIGNWAYRVDVPDSLSPSAFVRVIVHASLLEMANRKGGTHIAEIPLWLAEGLADDILATAELELILPSNKTKVNGLVLQRISFNERRANPLQHAQAVLRRRAPLTFEQLSWPTEEQLFADSIEVFRSSAQLFVRQLLQLKDGEACLRSTIGALPYNFNWQFALLHGFKAHFSTQLDIEKWWALQLVQFTGRDLMQTWTAEASWEKLNEIIGTHAEIRTNARELPRITEISLQTILREWDGMNQIPTLKQKLRQLDLFRPRVSQEFIGLVDDYRAALSHYLEKQNFSGRFFGLGKSTGPIRNRLTDETIRTLNTLDARRSSLKPRPETPSAESEQLLSAELR